MKTASLLVIIFLCSIAVSVADKCSGNCPSGSCSNCYCGTKTNFQSAATWCSKYKEWDQKCCQCIVQAESKGNANAVNYNANAGNGSYDVGLFQINSFNWKACNGGVAPCDVNDNLQCAIKVWKWGGKTFKKWATASRCGC